MNPEGEDVQFGNGFFGKLYKMVPDEKDKDVWVCKIRPTEITKEAYGLQDTDSERDRVTGAYTKKYPRDMVIERDRGNWGRSYIFLCGFNGEETDILEYIGSKNFRKIEFLRQEVELLKIQRIQTYRQIKEALNQPDLYRKQMFEEMVKVNEAAGAANTKPEERRTEEPYG